ncbi:MAG TPA: DUF1501 domain-containing protein [Planctomycetaceae bacterium]|nr:DUF1501 domain-containing protein [Planctomycetaceae bacterium]HCD02897.1 DUF1501 domain-containing protein [Planctomycetaceae bacterium]
MSAFPNQATRRELLSWSGMSLAGVALDAMISRDLQGETGPPPHGADPRGRPHFTPRAKSVIWLMMRGGASHHEGFDPKPALDRYAGKTLDETPFLDHVTKSPYYRNVKEQVLNNVIKTDKARILPLQKGYQKCGESGIEVSDWWPHTRKLVDDMAVVRSMWTTDNNHGAQLQFLSGRHLLDGCVPTVGAWIHYGLGSLSDNLPQFLSIGDRGMESQCAGGTDAQYLGPEHEGIWLTIDPKNPLPYANSAQAISGPVRSIKQDLLTRLQAQTAREYAGDEKLRARIKAYDLAFRMQTAIPDIMNLDSETRHTHSLYGLDNSATRRFGQQLLATRRLVEKGVRFVQVFHGGGAAGAWDAHANLIGNHDRMCGQADKPIAGLLSDLKQRGMLEDTVVVWTSEFGRTPGVQGKNGRDHHNYGFSVWMAGGGIKGGVVHGATDELGFHAVENRHYVTDVHATLFRLLGLDARRLEIPGRKRLEIDFGESIDEIIA